MERIDPIPLFDKGPLLERVRNFELGRTFDITGINLTDVAIRRVLGQANAGWWECDLANDQLTWTAGVYDIFGLPQGTNVTRDEAVSLYTGDSRAVMERLRRYAIGHRSGFIMDARIRPASGAPERWMRLIGAPSLEDGRTARLHGLKLIL